MIIAQDIPEPATPSHAGEVMTLEEIQKHFESEWVLVGDPETTDMLELIRGTILWHSKDRDEVYRQGNKLRPRHSALLYTGRIPPEGTAIVL